MAKRENALYKFGVGLSRFYAINDDGSLPSPSNIVGGIGPFDFTGETAANVPMTVKIDTVETEFTVDISAASVQNAVTVDEVVTALTAAFTSESLALTAEKDSTTGRLKISSSSGSPIAVQVYSNFAEKVMIGQGFGVKFIVSDTLKSSSISEIRKDAETFTQTDEFGYDTEVTTDGYHKGDTISLVDSANDDDLYDLFYGLKEGTDGYTHSPVSTTRRPFIAFEKFQKKYRNGENNEDEVIGFEHKIFTKCKALGGDESEERGFKDSNYTLTAMTHRDAAGNQVSSWKRKSITPSEFLALKVDLL